MLGKIALIVNENRALSTYPSVVNCMVLFLKNGYEVDLIVPKDMNIDCDTKNVTVIKYNYKGIFPVKIINGLIGIIHQLLSEKYNLILPYHAYGLIATGVACRIRKTPYGYFCLEIKCFDQIRNIKDKVMKSLEIHFNKKADFTIVQDNSRKELIKKTHGLQDGSIFCIPNSYLGPFNECSDYLRDKFEIPRNKTIALYSGALESWAIDENLILSVDGWDENYVLVLHGYCRGDYLEKVMKPLVEKINSKRKKIYLSLNLVDETEYMRLISSADIGLAWYRKDLPENVSTIGLSSGKMNAYLRCGIPIIVPTYLEDLRKFAEEYRIGVAVDSEYEIKNGILEIVNAHNYYKSNTINYYKENLDFEKKFYETFSSDFIP
ncbi:hypothetical protein EO93_06220 [Methanosarcina sp. 1.H.A.2.2]|nr:hypothetical protein EO93_06220 [Methanosarcina sp. 1.H.A.2.2]